MGFLRKVLEFFEVVRPTAVEFGSDPMSQTDVRALQAALRDRIMECAMLHRRAKAYEEELLRRGETRKSLGAMVALYERGLRAKEKLRKPA